MLSVNDIDILLHLFFMYVEEIEESMCVADVVRGVSTISICNSSFLATAGKLQKVGTAVLGNNIKYKDTHFWTVADSKRKRKVFHNIYCFMLF